MMPPAASSKPVFTPSGSSGILKWGLFMPSNIASAVPRAAGDGKRAPGGEHQEIRGQRSDSVRREFFHCAICHGRPRRKQKNSPVRSISST